MENNIPSTVEQPLNEREDTIGDSEVVVEHVPLLNGGPPTSQQDIVTPITTTETVTSTTAPAEPIITESVSISSTPPVSLTGVDERIPLTEPICLTTEDPQIRCTVCNTIDCMVHNPRHQYCMDCGQRLLGHMFAPIEQNILMYLDNKISLEQMKYDQWDQSITLLKYYCPGTMN